MENKNRHLEDDLLARWLSDEASEDEKQQVDDWSSESDENRKTIKDIEKIDDDLRQLSFMESINTSKALTKVKQRIGRKSSLGRKVLEYWQRAAAVIILPLLVYSIYQYMQNAEHVGTDQLAWHEISTPAGLRSNFTLPDGTKVWLNSGTTIKYPEKFEGNQRLVELSGEAYFDVKTNPKKPFVVDAGKMQAQAIGTSFNVLAYPDDNKIETALIEGKVNILEKRRGKRFRLSSLNPGQLAVYEKDKKLKLYEHDLAKHISWREGKMIFHRDPFEDLLRKLSHWYNVEFKIDSEINPDYVYSGSFMQEDLYQILKYIELTTPVKFEVSKPEQGTDTLFKKRIIHVKQRKQ